MSDTWSGWCGDADCAWGGPNRDTREEAAADLAIHEAETGHRTWYAGTVKPGMAIVNSGYPEGQPSVLDVLAVEVTDGWAYIHTPSGVRRLAADWPVEPYTRERADLETVLVMQACEDANGSA